MTVMMMITVALKAGDTVSSNTECSPAVAGKVGSSVFSPSNNNKKRNTDMVLDQQFLNCVAVSIQKKHLKGTLENFIQ